jgi:hypothetical protein
VHDLDICSLNTVVSVEGVRDPVLTVVVSTSSYLDFISYVVTLTSLRTTGLDRRRLSSCIASWSLVVVESETCVGSRVHLVGASISFEKNFYRLPFTPHLSGSPCQSFKLDTVTQSAKTTPSVNKSSLTSLRSSRSSP